MSSVKKVAATGKQSPKLDEQAALILQGLECAVSGMRAVYVSGPITNGPRFLKWFTASGRQLGRDSEQFLTSLRKHVIELNEREILEFASHLRLQGKTVIEPASLKVPGWRQVDYYTLWARVIDRFVDRMVMLPGWQYSLGCVIEFCNAASTGIRTEDVEGNFIDLQTALFLIRKSSADLIAAETGIDLSTALRRLESLTQAKLTTQMVADASKGTRYFRKDASLDRLAEIINVAQFISFSPGKLPHQEYCRVRGRPPNHKYRDIRLAIGELLAKSADLSVNVRSFRPDSPQSHEFIYGLKTIDDAISATERLASHGLHVIVNETINIHDGGISGVALGDIIEFAPDDTPRCVEKPGVASLPRTIALALLTTVYGFVTDVDLPGRMRLEFSIHPRSVGWRGTHTLGWELEEIEPLKLSPTFSWPNRFSRFIGDKAFGLMIADILGFRVPKTTVLSRRVAPFTFGQSTGSREIWFRTCPAEQVPGKFTTRHGWLDPFKLMSTEDPEGKAISSVLAQANIPAAYSGAVIVDATGQLIVEGKRGEGESLMLGLASHEPLPADILADVSGLYEAIHPILGPVRFEWVHDGFHPWIVQLHRGSTETSQDVIVPGEPGRWRYFDTSDGLSLLREQLSQMAPGEGIVIRGQVGLTSHIADVLRKANYPARISKDGS